MFNTEKETISYIRKYLLENGMVFKKMCTVTNLYKFVDRKIGGQIRWSCTLSSAFKVVIEQEV